jgi:hypothetical protein
MSRPAVEIAKCLGLPLETYYASVIFRSNLIDAGYTVELSGGLGPGVSIVVYGERFVFRVTVKSDRLRIQVQGLDTARSRLAFIEDGAPDFGCAFSVILRSDNHQLVGIRKSRCLRGS